MIYRVVMEVITHYTYHPSGFLTSKTRNNETTSYEYDHLYRLLRITLRDTDTNSRISQSFTYDEWDRITQVKDSIEAGKVFISGTEYDKLGRIKKEIYPGDYFIENKYDTYSNLKSIYDSHSRKIWEAMEVNAKGQMIKTRRGDKETQYAYDDRGFPVTIHTAGIFGMDYSFNEKGNMEWRKDLVSGYEEHFGYDELNRLTNWSIVKNGIQQSSHNQVYKAGKTHIESKTGYGSGFTYGENNGKPHAFTSFTPEAGRVFSDVQAIDYTDFKKMKSITQGSSALNVFYGVDEQRVKSVMNEASGTTTRYYLSNYEQEEKDGKVRKLHYISGGDGLAAIYVQSWDSKDTLYYAYTDYQGSLYAVTNETGTVQERYAYDPWGVRRNPSDWATNGTRAAFIFQRGYTFHEHLTEFNLINMNGRMYDPGAGMFFSPDPYIQAPGAWLNYNRYSYCLNNPLIYTDPDGELWWLIPALVGFSQGFFTHGLANGDWGWKAIASGAIAAGGAILGYHTIGGSSFMSGSRYAINSLVNTGLSYLVPPISIGIGDFNVSINPLAMFSAGAMSKANGFSFGSGFSASYQIGDWVLYAGIDSESKYGGFSYNDGNFGFSWHTTKYYKGIDGSSPGQRTATLGLDYKDWSISHENDVWVMLGDGGDRMRSAALEIGYKEWTLGVNVYTNDPKLGELSDDGKVYLDGVQYSSPLYIGKRVGYGMAKIGFEHAQIGKIFQNGFHKYITNDPILPKNTVKSRSGKPFVGYVKSGRHSFYSKYY